VSVYESRTLPNGLKELVDFSYECITILGSLVTPAIPGANASVLSFAQIKDEYQKDLEEEFPMLVLIPDSVKNNVKKGLELRKEQHRGGTSLSMSSAKYLLNNVSIPLNKLREIKSNFPNVQKFSISEIVETPTEDYINFMLWGGGDALKWIDESLIQFEANGKQNSERTENNMKVLKTMADGSEQEVEEEVMAAPVNEKTETPADEKAETPAEEKKEEEKGTEKKFEFPKNFDWEKMSALFSDDSDEDDVKMAKAELEKKEFCDPGIMMGGMYAKMCKMAESMCKMAEDNKVYMAENEELKKFKADFESSQKAFAVEKTLRELSEKVVISSEARDDMVAESEKYSFATIESWVTYCKAKSFDFAVKEINGKADVVRVGMPFTGTAPKKQNDLWS
jgi:hypothetical protein